MWNTFIFFDSVLSTIWYKFYIRVHAFPDFLTFVCGNICPIYESLDKLSPFRTDVWLKTILLTVFLLSQHLEIKVWKISLKWFLRRSPKDSNFFVLFREFLSSWESLLGSKLEYRGITWSSINYVTKDFFNHFL